MRLAHPRQLLTGLCLMGGLALVAPATSRADFISVWDTIPGGESNGLPVDARATFTAVGSTLTITLENLQANPKSVAQSLSDLFFTFTTGDTVGTLTSSSGVERTIAADGTFVDGGAVSTGWALLNNVSGGLHLDLLSTGTAPEHTIIGPSGPGNVYSNANNSITGNGPHNPFLAESATFVLNIPTLTDASRIASVTFSFNTASGFNVPGVPVPEPGTFALAGIGLGAAGVQALRRRNRRNPA